MSTATEEIVFQEPPIPNRGRLPIADDYSVRFANRCRERPGKHAIYTPNGSWYASQNTAYNVRNRIVQAGGPAWRDDVWDATTRKVDDGQWGVWARYLGPAGTDAETAKAHYDRYDDGDDPAQPSLYDVNADE